MLRSGKAANRPLASNAFWKKLIKPRKGTSFPDTLCIPDDRRNRNYQPFEVLTVETFRMLCPEFEWEASPVWGDKGADFLGVGARVSIAALNLRLHWIIVGQVKRRRRPPEGNFGDELKKLGKWSIGRPSSALLPNDLTTSPISGVIFVISTDRKSYLAELQKNLADPYESIHYTGPKYVIDADRLLAYWAADLDWFRSTVGEAVTPAELEELVAELSTIALDFDPQLDVTADVPRSALAGKAIRCSLEIHSVNPLPVTRFFIRYRPSMSDSDPIQVVRPTRMASPAGIPALITGTDFSTVEIWLRCYVAGRRDLGLIEILDYKTGSVTSTVDLGSVDVEASFEPPYYREPNLRHFEFAVVQIAEAVNGQLSAFSITGVGGAGKSRLCEEIVDYAADLGFAWVSLRQENAATRGRQLLRRVMSTLCPGRSEITSIETIIDHIRHTVEPSSDEFIAALQMYLTDDQTDVNPQAIAAALTALIVPTLHHRPLILHLHDLHWAGTELFTILHLMLDQLRLNEQRLKNGLVVLLEGRNREALRSATGEFRPPDEWLRFLAAAGLPNRAVEPWSEQRCVAYLRMAMRARTDATRPIEPERIPLDAELIEYVIRHAKGNPMHLMEQLRLMHKLGIVRSHSNGFLYVATVLPQDLDTPSDVLELIRARVALFRATAAAVIDMVVLFAKLGRTVSRALYDSVYDALDTPNARTLLEQLEVITIPRRDDESVEFVHENYFNALSNENIPPDSPLLARATSWFESRPLTPRETADFCRLLFLQRAPDYPKIIGIIFWALDESVAAETGVITEQLLRHLLRIPEGYRRTTRFDDATVRFELAASLTQVGSWEEAYRELESVVALTEPHRRRSAAALHWISAKAEMSSISVSLQSPEGAVAAADDAIQEVPIVLPAMPQIQRQLETQLAKAWHRKAVALWFDGRVVEAAPLQRKAFVLTRARQDDRENVVALREIGTLAFHRNLRLGVRLMEKSVVKAKAIGHSAGEIYNDHAQWLMGRIVAAGLDRDARVMAACLDEARTLHHASMHYAMLFDGVLAALDAGAASAWLCRLDEAHVWFRTASAIATQAQLLDEAWKARLNLAQVERELGREEEAALNATEAVAIMRRGLDVNPSKRSARRALMALPLAHALRLGAARAEIAPYLPPVRLQWMDDWMARPSFISRRSESQQVIHVRRSVYDYFLMN
jgi:tetratricopeptide (TPR) repeat protein